MGSGADQLINWAYWDGLVAAGGVLGAGCLSHIGDAGYVIRADRETK